MNQGSRHLVLPTHHLPHPLSLEWGDDVGNSGSPCPICPPPAPQPWHSPSPRTFPRLRAFLSTTTSCSFCWSSLLMPRLPTVDGEKRRPVTRSLQPPLLRHPSPGGHRHSLTRQLDGSAAVGLLGRVAHCQLRAAPAEGVPGGTETEPPAAASPPAQARRCQGRGERGRKCTF